MCVYKGLFCPGRRAERPKPRKESSNLSNDFPFRLRFCVAHGGSKRCQADGRQNEYLNKDPPFTLFKTSHNKYTNFAAHAPPPRSVTNARALIVFWWIERENRALSPKKYNFRTKP